MKIILGNLLRYLGFWVSLNYLVWKVTSKIFEFFVSYRKNSWTVEKTTLSAEDFIASLDTKLASEAISVSKSLKAKAKIEISNNTFGGGGAAAVCYFFTRSIRPKTIVETGVASGFVTYAFLQGLEDNKKEGRLYSSDLPYLKIKDSHRFIGELVPKHFKANWKLALKGDSQNLKYFLKEVQFVDIFHYDSDKSYLGRYRTMSKVLPKMSSSGVIIMDDIQDNCFFSDFIKAYNFKCSVFKEQNKLVGVAFMNNFEARPDVKQT